MRRALLCCAVAVSLLGVSVVLTAETEKAADVKPAVAPEAAKTEAPAVAPALASGQPATTPEGPVGIDRLLKLPGDLEFDVERRGGLTRSEWLARFEEARRSLAQAFSNAREDLVGLAKGE